MTTLTWRLCEKTPVKDPGSGYVFSKSIENARLCRVTIEQPSLPLDVKMGVTMDGIPIYRPARLAFPELSECAELADNRIGSLKARNRTELADFSSTRLSPSSNLRALRLTCRPLLSPSLRSIACVNLCSILSYVFLMSTILWPTDTINFWKVRCEVLFLSRRVSTSPVSWL